MAENIMELIEKLHAPFAAEQRVEQEYPPVLYASRLNDVFGHRWSSKIEQIDYWGREFAHITIEVWLPGGTSIERIGFSHPPFESACQMFGIGGEDASIAYYAPRYEHEVRT